MNPDLLSHLPLRKRTELQRVVRILFDEFEEAQKGKLSDERKNGRILKVILFGSYARGDWVEDHKGGYYSDYDLLVIVNTEAFTDHDDYWDWAQERLTQDHVITRRLKTPVSFIVHSLADVNDQLSRGRPFFVDIARDGIVLYEAPGHPLAAPKPLSPAEIREEAQRHFDHWFPNAEYCLTQAKYAIKDHKPNHAAFNLHQSVEWLYHCVLLTLTLYSPKLHKLIELRRQGERVAPRLIEIWPRNTRFSRRSFARLDRAYIDARYSPKYEITDEELAWLVERVAALQEAVGAICTEHLAE